MKELTVFVFEPPPLCGFARKQNQHERYQPDPSSNVMRAFDSRADRTTRVYLLARCVPRVNRIRPKIIE